MAWWAILSLGFIFAVTVLSLRYWVLPNIESYRVNIANAASRAMGQKVTIERISANWERARPHLKLGGLQIYDKKNRPALFLDNVEATLSWSSLLKWDLRLRTFIVLKPILSVRREADGLIYVAGAVVNGPPGEDSAFGDWLLRQRTIIVKDAVIEWRDELRQAPVLNLHKVNLRLLNRGGRHRFGLTASPPRELSRPLDLRGELYGKTLNDFSKWRGAFYAALDSADMGAWGKWLPYPFEVKKGLGGIRFWLGFNQGTINHAAANLSLLDTELRIRPELPTMEIAKLTGILAWRDLVPGFQVQVKQLVVSGNSLTMPNSNAQIRYVPAQKKMLGSGEIRTTHLSLPPLATLANYLPLEGEVAQSLAKLALQGSVSDFSAQWQGNWRAPQEFSLVGKFNNLGFRSLKQWPGVTNLTGSVEATEKSGSVLLDSRNVVAQAPEIMPEPLQFSQLKGRVNWTGMGPTLQLKIPQLVFANGHMAGQASGNYSSVANTLGSIDVSAKLTRADARYVWHYLPFMIHKDVRDWVKNGLVGGTSNDVKLVIKGNLSRLPFADKKSGLFQVKAKFVNGILDYGPGWPRAENIAGEVVLENEKIDVRIASGHIHNMKLSGVQATIADLVHGNEILLINGEAKGASNDLLKFIVASPVSEWLQGATSNMAATGQGKLLLKLSIPLRHPENHKVTGSYQFIDNHLQDSKQGWPALERLTGVLNFSQDQVYAKDIHAQALGGPVRMNIQSHGNDLQIDLAGIADAQHLSRIYAPSVLPFVQGKAAWQGHVSTRANQATIKIDSDLVGVAVNLPQPLFKAPQEALAMNWESLPAPASAHTMKFNYGNRIAGNVLQAADNRIDRGVIRLGGAAMPSEQPGLWVSGETPYLDLDAWRNVAKRMQAPSGNGQTLTERTSVAGADVTIASLDVFEHRIHNVKLEAKQKDQTWSANISARELTGAISWQPEGRGKVVARLKSFTFPDSDGNKSAATSGTATLAEDMPVLDITAENIMYNKRNLGALEVLAVPQSKDWHIEKFKLANADGVIQGSGVWQDWQPKSLTKIDVLIETGDLGKFLARWGQPDRLAKGSAKLSGQLSWAGEPIALDFPSLSGALKLEAKNGRFLKIEPGLGKLIGLLSLQALPRRITLDFRDVFSDGFSFDSIAANVSIQRGVASSNDFKMQGPAAKVAMQGETDLAKETQNLRVKVTPLLAESVAMAGTLIGGPVVGLATYVVQKALQNPFDQIAAYEYGVTGTWEDPKVAKIPRTAEPVAPAP